MHFKLGLHERTIEKSQFERFTNKREENRIRRSDVYNGLAHPVGSLLVPLSRCVMPRLPEIQGTLFKRGTLLSLQMNRPTET